MNVLLIFPSADIESRQGRKEPLGICYISAYLKQHGHNSKVIDQIDETEEDIINEIKRYHPTVVGISAMTYNYLHGLSLAKRIRSEFAGITTFFGGAHVSGMPDVVKENAIDIAIIGEGELTTLDLVNAIENDPANFDLEKIRGISYLKNGEVRITAPRERIISVDELPFPDRSNLPMDKYIGKELKYLGNRKMASIHTARGCSGNCTFCTTPMLYKGGWIARNAKNVVDEIEQLIERYHVKTIFFADEDFLQDRARVYAICDELIKRKVLIFWFCFSKVTDIEQDIMNRMRQAGCINIMLGIEAMHDESLRKIAKKVTVNKTREAIKIAHKTGLIIGGTYMLGYPWETHENLIAGLKELRKLHLDHIYLNYITPFPGTPFYKDCQRKGLIGNYEFDSYDCYSPIVGANLCNQRDFDYRSFRKKTERKMNWNIMYAYKVIRNIVWLYSKQIAKAFRIDTG